MPRSSEATAELTNLFLNTTGTRYVKKSQLYLALHWSTHSQNTPDIRNEFGYNPALPDGYTRQEISFTDSELVNGDYQMSNSNRVVLRTLETGRSVYAISVQSTSSADARATNPSGEITYNQRLFYENLPTPIPFSPDKFVVFEIGSIVFRMETP